MQHLSVYTLYSAAEQEEASPPAVVLQRVSELLNALCIAAPPRAFNYNAAALSSRGWAVIIIIAAPPRRREIFYVHTARMQLDSTLYPSSDAAVLCADLCSSEDDAFGVASLSREERTEGAPTFMHPD